MAGQVQQELLDKVTLALTEVVQETILAAEVEELVELV
jgi:hypothetical protein